MDEHFIYNHVMTNENVICDNFISYNENFKLLFVIMV